MTHPAPLPKERLRELAALAEKATPGPWRSKALGGDSIVLAPTHRWNKPYVIPEHGYPIALPRTYQQSTSDGEGLETVVDYTSAGFSHEDAAFIAACSPDTIKALLAHIALLEAENTVLLKRAKPPANPSADGEG